MPAFRERAHDGVDSGARADIDADGRAIEDQEARIGREPLGQDDLLLVAARQRRDRVRRLADLHAEVAYPLGDQRIPFAEGDQGPGVEEAVENRYHRVVFDRLRLKEPERQAIF